MPFDMPLLQVAISLKALLAELKTPLGEKGGKGGRGRGGGGDKESGVDGGEDRDAETGLSADMLTQTPAHTDSPTRAETLTRTHAVARTHKLASLCECVEAFDLEAVGCAR